MAPHLSLLISVAIIVMCMQMNQQSINRFILIESVSRHRGSQCESGVMTDTSRTKETKEIEILFEYQGHRKCKRSKILESIEKSLVDLVGLPQSSASPVTAVKVHTLQSSRRVRGKPGKKYYLLQRYVKDWSAFINVDSLEQVRNRDTLTIAQTVALNSTNESKRTESAEESADRKGKVSS